MRKFIYFGLIAALFLASGCNKAGDVGTNDTSKKDSNDQDETKKNEDIDSITIKSLSPASGLSGTIVTISGDGIDARVDKVVVLNSIVEPAGSSINQKDGELSFTIPLKTPVGNMPIKVLHGDAESNELVFKVTGVGKTPSSSNPPGSNPPKSDPPKSDPPEVPITTPVAEIQICDVNGEYNYTLNWDIKNLADGQKAYLYFTKSCSVLDSDHTDGKHTYECKSFAEYAIAPYKPVNYLDAAINKCLVDNVSAQTWPNPEKERYFYCSKITLYENDKGFITSSLNLAFEANPSKHITSTRQAVLEIVDKNGKLVYESDVVLENGNFVKIGITGTKFTTTKGENLGACK